MYKENAALNAGMIGSVGREAAMRADSPKGRLSAADEVASHLERLSVLSAEVSSLVGNKLSALMRDCGSEEKSMGECERAYPPYFSHLRANIQGIEYQLRCIAEYIERVEI